MLKSQADEAIKVCEKAAEQYPNELRFQYQLGRALAFKDRKRAQKIQQKLVSRQYPAAYDNLGWLVITEEKDHSKAVKLFRLGVQLGDPDAMVSLAEMIDRGYTAPLNSSETKIALLTRAAQLGHFNAAQALQVEQEQEVAKERQREMQYEQQRRAIEMFGRILQHIPR